MHPPDPLNSQNKNQKKPESTLNGKWQKFYGSYGSLIKVYPQPS